MGSAGDEVYNSFAECKLILTTHAVERWEERVAECKLNPADMCLTTCLANAIPFGGQRHGGLLLLSGQLVFTITFDVAQGKRIVTSVLHKHQAVGNMQASSWESKSAKVDAPAASRAPESVQSISESRATSVEIIEIKRVIQQLPQKSNDELDTLHAEAISFRQDPSKSKVHATYGKLISAIEAERGRRRKIGHTTRQASEYQFLKIAIGRVVSEEVKFQIYEIAKGLREAAERQEQEKCKASA